MIHRRSTPGAIGEVLTNGALLDKAGTATIALLAKNARKPIFVLCNTSARALLSERGFKLLQPGSPLWQNM